LRSIKHAQVQFRLHAAEQQRRRKTGRAMKLNRLAAQCAAAMGAFVPAEMDQRNRHRSNLKEFGRPKPSLYNDSW
jgi:hypothetical protein